MSAPCPDSIAPALQAMAAYPQWVCWDLVQRADKPKPDKVPVDPLTRFPINPHDPKNWMTAENALAHAKAQNLGIGFVFTARDPFFFLDLDECATPQGSSEPWQEHALQLFRRLPGVAAEISCSGRGMHLFGRCAPGLLHSNKNAAYRIELYTDKRFVAIGHSAQGDANVECTAALQAIIEEFFPPRAVDTEAAEWSTEAEPGTGIANDDTLIRIAINSKSAEAAFGDKASMKDLWEGNEEALAVAFPDPVRPYDDSRADAAMAARLLFFAGGNCEQVQRIMMRSGLRREKWDREDYLPRTILFALAGMDRFYTGRYATPDPDAPPVPPPGAPPQAAVPTPPQALAQVPSQPTAVPTPPLSNVVQPSEVTVLPAQRTVSQSATLPTPVVGPDGDDDVTDLVPPAEVMATITAENALIDGTPLITPDQMWDMWRDYVYVLDVNRVLTPDGRLISDTQFKVWFGTRYFPTDHVGGNTNNAWLAYTNGHCYEFPKAQSLWFRPGMPARMFWANNQWYANSWTDPQVVQRKGDPTPFLRHLKKLLPNGNDAEILLAYLAACVQYQGTKFTWCPLIQGIQGNGKSTIAKVLEHAIGERYVHQMDGHQLFESKFNAWLSKSIVVAVHDLKVASAEHMNKIKPMITETRQSIERKRVDQVTEYVCANFILTTNYQNAIKLEVTERRFTILFCAQQEEGDLQRDGLTPEYFEEYFEWLEKRGGYQILAHFLRHYQIPDQWNPATKCKVAPITTTRDEALKASESPLAQHISIAIQAEEPGFRGGWVSSEACRRLLKEDHGIRMSPRSLGLALRDMGYQKHPGLPNGQATRVIPQENGKRPTLYVRPVPGHLSLNLKDRLEIIIAYEKAQGYPDAQTGEPTKEPAEPTEPIDIASKMGLDKNKDEPKS